jgi:putative NADH-flavin reductase
MKLLVLGATGGVGIELVRQSIERGHSVTAFVRKPEPLKPFTGRLAVATGNLLDAAELAQVIRGHDAVLSAFGPRIPIAPSDAHLLRDFAASLTSAMHQATVPRGIIVSTAFLFKDAIFPPTHLFGRLFFPGVVKDAADMESILRSSGLDLLVVRPPELKDKPHTGKYRVREDHLPRFGFSIPRADVADFMVHTAERGDYRNSVVGVSK